MVSHNITSAGRDEEDLRLDWVLAQLVDAAPLATSAELAWFHRVEELAPDATAALRHARESGRYEQGLELALLMARYWWVCGQNREGLTWLWTFLGATKGARLEQAERVRDWLLKLSGADDLE